MTQARPGGTAALGERTVSRIGYGAMQLGEGEVDDLTAVAVLRRAVELGVDHVDTADFYGHSRSNELIRTALAPYDGSVVVATKVGAVREGAGLVAAQKPEELRAQVHANLASLGAERLDVVNLRRIDSPPGIVATGDQVVDLDDQLAELVALREEGLVGAVGLSNVDVDQLQRALPVGIACVQNSWSLLDHTSAAVFERCREEGIAWAPYFPLGSAFERFPSVTDAPAVRSVAQRTGVTPAQVGLAWLLAESERTLLIPGTRSLAHLEENLAAGDVRLDAEALAELAAA